MNDTLQWVEKYRPQTINEFVFKNNESKQFFEKIIKTGEIPSMLFSGTQGSGKTTLARILINELINNDYDVLTINCSDENSVDTIREKVSSFALTVSMEAKYKIIEMSEADYLSLNAQAALRHLIEESIDNCRFIFTCNYPTKIMNALHSRLHHVEFSKPDNSNILLSIVKILSKEKIIYNIVDINNVINLYYPDIRKIINILQQNINENNELKLNILASETDSDFINLINNLENTSLSNLQQFVGKISPTEFENYYASLYRHERFKDMPDIYINIADRLYQHSIVGLPEITFLTLLIELKRALND